jgi:hypothetical protein
LINKALRAKNTSPTILSHMTAEAISQFTLRGGRTCQFTRVRSFFLRHYFVLTFSGEPSTGEAEELFALALRWAGEQSTALVGAADSLTLIHNGLSARRVRGWHLHVVILRGRLEKAWLYLTLTGKNLLQALRLRKDPAPEKNNML